MPFQSPLHVRGLALCLATILSLQALWIVVAELVRPDMNVFPRTAEEAKGTASSKSASGVAANIGWLRGQLWTAYAIALTAAQIGDVETGGRIDTLPPEPDAKRAMEIAATLSPSDARTWLLMSMSAQSEMATAQLKMSYYTSPYSADIFPLRIHVAVQSPSIAEDELSGFVEFELGTALRNTPNSKDIVASAYRAARPPGRHFLETALAKLDSRFLSELKIPRP